jgi:hypothetical protein
MDGYLAMLIGQNVPHAKAFTPSAKERDVWRNRCNTWALEAKRGFDVRQCLDAIRKPGMKWN